MLFFTDGLAPLPSAYQHTNASDIFHEGGATSSLTVILTSLVSSIHLVYGRRFGSFSEVAGHVTTHSVIRPASIQRLAKTVIEPRGDARHNSRPRRGGSGAARIIRRGSRRPPSGCVIMAAGAGFLPEVEKICLRAGGNKNACCHIGRRLLDYSRDGAGSGVSGAASVRSSPTAADGLRRRAAQS